MQALKRYHAGAYEMKEGPRGQSSKLSDSSRQELIGETIKLRRQLKAIIAQARQNEEKLQRFQALELKLIGCNSLSELIQVVLFEYRSTSNLDVVKILLHDPEYEIQRLLEEDGFSLQDSHDLLFTESLEKLEKQYGLSPRPYLGPYDGSRHEFLFAGSKRTPASIALLPIVRHGEIIGSLNIGSYKTERYVAGTASDFLQRLSTIIGICLDNVKNSERLKRVGLTDVLTGVNNRRFFDQRLIEEICNAQRHQTPLSCLFFDVDHFKKVNDTYGHPAGDLVLQEVANLIRSKLRTSDVLARYGGEEFSALLNQTAAQKAYEIAERIRCGIEKMAFVTGDGTTIRVTISIGMATLKPGNPSGPPEAIGSELVQQADNNLYIAKRSGRNKVVSHHLVNEVA